MSYKIIDIWSPNSTMLISKWCARSNNGKETQKTCLETQMLHCQRETCEHQEIK